MLFMFRSHVAGFTGVILCGFIGPWIRSHLSGEPLVEDAILADAILSAFNALLHILQPSTKALLHILLPAFH